MEASLDVAIGGRIAEEIFFGNENITTGCGSDLNNATRSAYSMLVNYSFDNWLISQDIKKFSKSFRFLIDQSAQNLLQKSYRRTFTKLNENKSLIEKLARRLVERETMDAKEVRLLLNIPKK